MMWVSRVTSIGLSFVVPVILGVLADRLFKTSPAFTVAGVVLGFVVGTLQVVRLAGGKETP